MKASITYLHLLRHTPFFTALNKPQLQWVIDHSREWEVSFGETVASRTDGKLIDDAVWVLLDGGWKVETGVGEYPAGHADPGKWFSAADISVNCRLIATEASFVMKIERTALDIMMSQGFGFGPHLEAGHEYYRDLL